MAVKDEIALADMILAKPRVAMGHDAAKHIGGGSNTGPNFQPQTMAEEITAADLRKTNAPARAPVTQRFAQDVKRDMRQADRILTNDGAKPLTEALGFEQSVEALFENVNSISAHIDEYAGAAGRVSRKMEEHWNNVLKALKTFEIYYDRTMQRLES